MSNQKQPTGKAGSTPAGGKNDPTTSANPAEGAPSAGAGDDAAKAAAKAAAEAAERAEKEAAEKEAQAKAAKPKKPQVLSKRTYEDGRTVQVLQDDTRVWKEEVPAK